MKNQSLENKIKNTYVAHHTSLIKTSIMLVANLSETYTTMYPRADTRDTVTVRIITTLPEEHAVTSQKAKKKKCS